MRIAAVIVLLSLLAFPVVAKTDAETAAAPLPAASCPNATPAVAAADEPSEEDWARLGFEVVAAPLLASSVVESCPVTTTCTAFSGCEDTNECRTVNTGQSCCVKAGHQLCCIVGTIHITRCSCTTDCNPFCDPCPESVVRTFSCQTGGGL